MKVFCDGRLIAEGNQEKCAEELDSEFCNPLLATPLHTPPITQLQFEVVVPHTTPLGEPPLHLATDDRFAIEVVL